MDGDSQWTVSNLLRCQLCQGEDRDTRSSNLCPSKMRGINRLARHFLLRSWEFKFASPEDKLGPVWLTEPPILL